MLIYLIRQKNILTRNKYFFKQYNSNLKNYETIDLNKLKKIPNNYDLKIIRLNNNIIIDIINNKFTVRYYLKINKTIKSGFLKSNKNVIIVDNNLYKNIHGYPLFKIGKINKNEFKIIINKYNYSNLNRIIYNNYLYITIKIVLLLFN